MNKILKKAILSVAMVAVGMSAFVTEANAQTTMKTGVATVIGQNLRLRSNDSLVSTVVDYATKNDIVVVLEKRGDWYKVNYNLQEGYMHSSYLKFIDIENVELGYGRVCGDYVNLRAKPTLNSKSLKTIPENESVYIIGINQGWYKVVYKDTIGYMRSDFVELTEIPYENKDSQNEPVFFKDGKWMVDAIDTGLIPTKQGVVEEKLEEIKDTQQTITSGLTTKVLEVAKNNLGVPYVWGGTTPNGFDCSGFVYYVFNQAGYPLSRSMAVQYKTGTPIEKSDLIPGDIVFFQNTYTAGMSHVGIYVGDGQFIHAPSSGKNVSYADLNSDYYTAHYYGACRITN